MSDYPEHDKLTAIADQTQAIGDFHDWLGTKGIFLARYIEGSERPRHVHGFRDLLAEWAGIDQDRLETEKRTMLERIRATAPAGPAQPGAPAANPGSPRS